MLARHDVHITSLVGTARRMAAELDSWSGTLMLIGQPAEEWKISGAQAMHQDRQWERFGQPDYALAFHVAADIEAGKSTSRECGVLGCLTAWTSSCPASEPMARRPHRVRKDPVLIGAQIVVALQQLVSRELSPREPGVVTVGVFRAG